MWAALRLSHACRCSAARWSHTRRNYNPFQMRLDDPKVCSFVWSIRYVAALSTNTAIHELGLITDRGAFEEQRSLTTQWTANAQVVLEVTSWKHLLTIWCLAIKSCYQLLMNPKLRQEEKKKKAIKLQKGILLFALPSTASLYWTSQWWLTWGVEKGLFAAVRRAAWWQSFWYREARIPQPANSPDMRC